jgi:hypothetical protein
MKYDRLVQTLLNEFNDYSSPSSSNAGAGTNIGSTVGDKNNTFPSSISKVSVNLPDKPSKKKKRKKSSKMPVIMPPSQVV